MNSFRALLLSTVVGITITISAHVAGILVPPPALLPKTARLIRATHYTADVSAPDFWSRVSVSQAKKDFRSIREAGFNTVILIASWTGFQPALDPASRSEGHHRLLGELLKAAEQEGLDVLLRVGYAHDISNTPDKLHHERAPGILGDTNTREAWLSYLRDIQGTASAHPNFRYAFLTWEDFFFFDYTYADEPARKAGAERLGYVNFLRTLPEGEYRRYYGSEAREDRVHPIPVYNTPQIVLFSRFWDQWLLKLFAESRAVMPKLNMEVRVDCDPVPLPERFVCHEGTFDLGGAPNATTIIYYTPAWGAENRGEFASADEALGRFQYMLQRVREKTENPIFIDQFNFVDNTPGFERNTRIEPSEVGDFLEKAGTVIAGQTAGYALWTMWDVTANIAANGEFERGLDGWKTVKATVMSSQENGQYVRLEPGGDLSYFVREGGRAGVPIRAEQKFTLSFRTRSSEGTPRFRVEVLDANGATSYLKESVSADAATGIVQLADLPYFAGRETLRIGNLGGETILDGILLFNGRQENGILSADRQPKPFTDAVLALNRRLALQSEAQPSYTAESAQSPFVKGVHPDGWVGKRATLWLGEAPAAPVLNAYIPETWSGYSAELSARLNGHEAVKLSLRPGLNTLVLPKPAAYPALLSLSCDATVKASRFDNSNRDGRDLCFVLKEVGPQTH